MFYTTAFINKRSKWIKPEKLLMSGNKQIEGYEYYDTIYFNLQLFKIKKKI